MLVIRVLLNVKPENQQEFAQVIKEDSEKSREFEGCQRFNVYKAMEGQDAYLLYEEWDSQSAFDAYRNSPHFKAQSARLFPMIDGSPDSAYYDAALLS